ncbi:hypothetical protein SAMN02745945_00316 [Peptoclostridium litorale DSM 5388]|uniref:Uncharacterized protein n=1 Tax=Peptoclostridium litorale DSM 5388 TaxID=1121324 RepID=A0A069RQJ1_PEPLI|nr:hypothetical protein [Peptoclostridium litorale]KDR96442.1 hypothetical protein CLIT_2c00480 [Peptoclostridium litorale DSM 5388]SIN70540.1 hypothetical protein SAMN02745945_00316 [Peptoclostridium litorale DSM 5388]
MRRRKNTKFYIFYGIAIAAYIIAAGAMLPGEKEMPAEGFDWAVENAPYLIWFAGFGGLTGLIGVFEQKRYTGYWMFEWTKFTVFFTIGLILSAMHFMPFLNLQVIKPHMEAAAPYFKNNIILVFGMFLIGWALPSSIYKERLR